MTREEALDWLCRLRSKIYVYMPKEWQIPMNNALDTAIKALEQEPCEDAVSRQAVAQVLLKYAHSTEGKAFAEFLISQINDLPSVNPQQEPCDVPGANVGDMISRAAVDRLKSDIMSWINSDNRGSADYFIVDKIEELVKSFNPPSVTPQPKVGHWVRDTITDLYHCSECRCICHQDPRSKDDYCRWCGARMEESEG